MPRAWGKHSKGSRDGERGGDAGGLLCFPRALSHQSFIPGGICGLSLQSRGLPRGRGGGGCCGPISPLLGEPQGSGRCESPQLGQPACQGDTGALDKAFLLFPLFAVEML